MQQLIIVNAAIKNKNAVIKIGKCAAKYKDCNNS